MLLCMVRGGGGGLFELVQEIVENFVGRQLHVALLVVSRAPVNFRSVVHKKSFGTYWCLNWRCTADTNCLVFKWVIYN